MLFVQNIIQAGLLWHLVHTLRLSSMDDEETKQSHVDTANSTSLHDAKSTPPPLRFSQACTGYAIVLIGVLILSLDALVIDEALAEGLNDWALVFYRYLLSTATVLFFMTLIEGGPQHMPAKFEKVGSIGLLASCFQALACIMYTLAISHTHVANVMIIMSSASMWTALFSAFIFNEVLPLRLIVAIVVAFLAVAVVVGLSMTLDDAWEGNVYALMSALSMALFFVIVRSVNADRAVGDKIDMVPCNILGGLLVVVVAGSVCAAYSVGLGDVTDRAWLFLAVQGIFVLAIGNTCLTLATQYIAATEVTIVLLLDTVLEPVWVWLAGLDTPPYYSLYAGVVVVFVLGVNATLALLEEADVGARAASVARDDERIDAEADADGGAGSEVDAASRAQDKDPLLPKRKET